MRHIPLRSFVVNVLPHLFVLISYFYVFYIVYFAPYTKTKSFYTLVSIVNILYVIYTLTIAKNGLYTLSS